MPGSSPGSARTRQGSRGSSATQWHRTPRPPVVSPVLPSSLHNSCSTVGTGARPAHTTHASPARRRATMNCAKRNCPECASLVHTSTAEPVQKPSEKLQGHPATTKTRAPHAAAIPTPTELPTQTHAEAHDKPPAHPGRHSADPPHPPAGRCTPCQQAHAKPAPGPDAHSSSASAKADAPPT